MSNIAFHAGPTFSEKAYKLIPQEYYYYKPLLKNTEPVLIQFVEYDKPSQMITFRDNSGKEEKVWQGNGLFTRKKRNVSELKEGKRYMIVDTRLREAAVLPQKIIVSIEKETKEGFDEPQKGIQIPKNYNLYTVNFDDGSKMEIADHFTWFSFIEVPTSFETHGGKRKSKRTRKTRKATRRRR